MPKKDFHVLIIGAGSAGLLIAQGLRASSIPCTVFERQDTLTYGPRQRNWTMALHWGNEALDTVLPPSLLAELKNVQGDPSLEMSQEEETSFPFVNGKTGEVMARIRGFTTRRANKEKLRTLLSNDVDVRYGKKLVDIVEEGDKVTAVFEDGTRATGDALVGCDAGDSVVRHWLLGKEKAALETLKLEMYNITQSYTAEQARFIREQYHPLIKISIHPEIPLFFLITMANVPDPADPASWSFQLIFSHWGTDPPASPSERMTRFKELTKNVCEPFRTAAQNVSGDTYMPEDNITHWPNITLWPNHNGRITLAGDAAHCMTPYRGQGLNNALQDAALYVAAIRRLFPNENVDTSSKDFTDKLKVEIDAYDQEVVERGKKEITISAYQVEVTHLWENFLDSPIVKQGLSVKK